MSIYKTFKKKYYKIKTNNLLKIKWKEDKIECKNLSNIHKRIYFDIFKHHYKSTGSFPNIVNPKSYNDKIAWLMIFDQNKLMPQCTDKILVRDFVKSRLGDEYLTNLYGTYESFNDINFDLLPNSFVVKTNHDSGTVFIIKDKSIINIKKIKESINKSLSKTYGGNKGEWAYSFIDKKILIEECLSKKSETLPPDYKFHCVNGKVRWLQYIYDRGQETKECVYDNKFNIIPVHLDLNFKLQDPNMTIPRSWDSLILAAETLSIGFKYVRVDLYNIKGRIVFGELTFFPRAGCYITPDNETFGNMLDFDTSQVKEPLYLKDSILPARPL